MADSKALNEQLNRPPESIGNPLYDDETTQEDIPDLDGAYTAAEEEDKEEHSIEDAEANVDQANYGWIFYLLFSNPALLKSKGLRNTGFGLIIFVNLLIVVSTVAICAETVEAETLEQREKDEELFGIIEVITVAVFSIDFLVKAIGTLFLGEFMLFVKDYMNWLDLLSILPFYIERIIGEQNVDLRFLRVARMTRFTRVFRMSRLLRASNASRYGNVGDTIVGIFSEAGPALVVPFLFMVLSILVFSIIVYEFERWAPQITSGILSPSCPYKDKFGDCQQEIYEATFYSSVQSFWWAIVSFSTVGYGDKYPDTGMGKMVCVVAMVTGIFYLAMPLAIIGGAFVKQFGRLRARRARHAIVEAMDEGKQMRFDVDSLDDYTDEICAHLNQMILTLDEIEEYSSNHRIADHLLSRISRFEAVFEQYCIIFGTLPTLHTKFEDVNRKQIGQDGGYHQH